VEDMDLFVLREFLRPKRVLNAVTQGVDVGTLLDGAPPARA
jgi:hypothetical protein